MNVQGKNIFRGLDNWQKVGSISTGSPNLFLCWGWWEEAYEIDDKDTFEKVNNSIRGQLPEGYFKQIVYSYNPWQESNFIVSKLVEAMKPDEERLERDGEQIKIKRGTYEIKDNRYKGGKKTIESERLYMITNYKINEFLSDVDEHRMKK